MYVCMYVGPFLWGSFFHGRTFYKNISLKTWVIDIEADCDSPDTEPNIAQKEDIEKKSCPLTLSASSILVVKFKMRHGLTKEALSDLLKLIKPCPTPNLCCRSMYLSTNTLWRA
jgi:hypothetical protein